MGTRDSIRRRDAVLLGHGQHAMQGQGEGQEEAVDRQGEGVKVEVRE